MRVAIITGGMGELGDSISTKMHASGYRVVVTHSPANTKAKEWISEHKASGREFSAYPVDVADFDSCKECVARIANEVGPIDILFRPSRRCAKRIQISRLSRHCVGLKGNDRFERSR
jgi:acetoacetyl-CoA reductase